MEPPETDEEVIEFGRTYALHELISKYLNDKDKEILEEIKKICKNDK